MTSDGTGYYAYLPNYIVYNNEKPFDFIDTIVKNYPDKNLSSMLCFYPNSTRITNKFYVGTPLLQSPFYAAAHGIIKMTGQKADGYSRGYRFSIQLAALFWVLTGMIALIHFLRSIGVSAFSSTLVALLIALGTNLNTYSVYVPSMSHAYSFAIISLFLYIASKWSKSPHDRHFIFMCLLLGIIAILRPVNLIIIFFLPLLFDHFLSFIERIKILLTEKFKLFLLGLVVFFCFVAIQLFVHHDITDSWSIYTYSGEGFDNWNKPQFLNVLFSSEKGFFLYGPLLLLILPGISFLSKFKEKYFTFGWLLFVVILFYMISSWWDWAYGGSLGMRPLIEFLPVLIIPIAFMIDQLNNWKKQVLLVFAAVCVIQFQFFQFQFNQHILPYSHVTWEQLARIKWKTAPRFEWMFGYDNDTIPLDTKLKKIGTSYFRDGWITNGQLCGSKVDSIGSCISVTNYPFYGKLTGEVMINADNSNPAIYLDYFNKGSKVRSAVQPFGNQIERLNNWTSIQQSYNTKVPFDSISFRLETFGQTNAYRNLRIDWFTLK